eukprot:TRINITY_DN10235_c0_g1_i2.p1 TRINITY_DN10235_c0_g1~~TRINITY_DN10235_c0_g1_i2.p1  ORF type:complete len:241 (-),score=76.31 TRINITY_DN10235_c0_g1_i2:195-917(-)
MCIRDRYQRRVRDRSHEMAWVVKRPLCRADVFCALFLCVVSLIGFVVGVVGIEVIPKCRYGDRDCYFTVKLCPFNSASPRIKHEHDTGPACVNVLKTRAVEGSSDVSGEQFGLPVCALVISLIPCVLTMVAVLFDKALALLEVGKVCVAVNIAVMLMAIRIVDNVTFDCRWWADKHHGNSDQCHNGLALYVVGTVLLIAAQISLLTLAVIFVERERDTMYSKDRHETLRLTKMQLADDIF